MKVQSQQHNIYLFYHLGEKWMTLCTYMLVLTPLQLRQCVYCGPNTYLDVYLQPSISIISTDRQADHWHNSFGVLVCIHIYVLRWPRCISVPASMKDSLAAELKDCWLIHQIISDQYQHAGHTTKPRNRFQPIQSNYHHYTVLTIETSTTICALPEDNCNKKVIIPFNKNIKKKN